VNLSRSIAPLTIAALTLTACNNDRPARDPEYYARNTQEAQLRVDVCNRLGIEERGAECLNATDGIGRAVRGHGNLHL
jgi:hypothetical protein